MGVFPDMGEYLALRKLLRAVRDIEAGYEGGACVTIFSDFHTFAKYIAVGKGDYVQYFDNLKQMIQRLGAGEVIRVVNFHEHEEFSSAKDDYDYQNILELLYGNEAFGAERIDAKIAECEETKRTYRGMIRFMEADQKPVIGHLSNRGRAKVLAHIAKGMITSGRALDKFLLEKFPGAIRLSIHCYQVRI